MNDWIGFTPVFGNIGNHEMILSSRELQKQLNWLKSNSLMINCSMFDRSYITPLPATETATKQDFEDWDFSDDYQKILQYRLNSSNCDSILLEGLD